MQMRKMFFLILTASVLMSVSASASTELGIGIFDYILSRTDFKDVTCETYSCNYVSTDRTVRMKLVRANLVQHITKDLNFMLDISFDSPLFKSGLLVQYYNNRNLIRVFIKGASTTIESKRKNEITTLKQWLENALSHVKSS